MSLDLVELHFTLCWHTGRWSEILKGLESEVREALDVSGEGRYSVVSRVFPAFIVCKIVQQDQTINARSIVSQLKTVAATIVRAHHDPLPVPYLFSRYVYIHSASTAEGIADWLEFTARNEGGQASAKARASMQREKTLPLLKGTNH